MNELKSKLHEFGLSDKESNVYLAMLELGPSSAQDIAKKAGVNRATTYVMLESLKRRGLMSSVERGKKILFAAESPEHLISVVESEVQTARGRKERLESVMPQFMALFNAIEDKPKVRFFEGEEGISACREAIGVLSKNQSARIITSFDEITVRIYKTNEEQRTRLASGNRSVRMLYTINVGLELPKFNKMTQLRPLPAGMLPFTGELYIYDTCLLVGASKTRPIGVILESADIVSMFQSIFEYLWKRAESSSGN